MIVADTGAIVALVDADDSNHHALVALYEAQGSRWVLPWAILPEVDYLLSRRVGADAARAFRADLATGAFVVEWGKDGDLQRAHELCTLYAALDIGLVDAVVAALAERLRATAIVTLDIRDFGAMTLNGTPRLLPRDGR
jgi:predicted nucleic acid-binding protein